MGITFQLEGSMKKKPILIYNWEGEVGAWMKKENPYFMMIRTIYHYHHLGKISGRIIFTVTGRGM